MLEKTDGTIKNGQFIDKDKIRPKTQSGDNQNEKHRKL